MSATTEALQRRWERLRTVPGLGRDVAVLVVLVVAGLVAASVIQGNSATSAPWSDRSTVKVEFESVPGVNPKSSHVVTMAGVRVGKIKDWEVSKQGTAVLTLDIDPGHPVYSNARAVLRPKNPLNEMQVEINPGGPPGKKLPDGGTIPLRQTERPIQADEVLAHLDERTQQAVSDLLVESDIALVRASEDLPAGLGKTSDALGVIRPVVGQLVERREQLQRLATALADISRSVGKNDRRLAVLADATQQTLSTLASNDREIRQGLEQLPGLGDDLRNALTRTKTLTKELNPTLDNLGNASEELPVALKKLRKTVGTVGELVDVARPVVTKARPLVADLRPLVSDVESALGDLRPVTKGLDDDTATVTRYLDDIAAFVYNTASVFGAGDTKETGIIRGHFTLALPDGGFLPGGRGAYSPDPKDSFEGKDR